jgi:dipeptidyl aminopeptidase/acylaminoacyl peptidase
VRRFVMPGVLALLATAGNAQQAAVPAPNPARISAADFAALPLLVKPKLSPDGHRIAAQNVADGKTTIVVLNADDPDKILRTIPMTIGSAYSLLWAGNRKLLLTVLLKQKSVGVETPYLRLVSLDVEDGTAQILDRQSRGIYAGDVLYADPTGSWAIVASQDSLYDYPSVKRVDLSTGKATVIEQQKDEVWDWYADDEGVVRAGVAYSNRTWTVWYRDKPGEKLRALKGKFAKKDDGAVDKFIFRGNQSWILTNERTGRFALYKYDTSTATVGDAIFEHPKVDVDDLLYDAATGNIRAIEYEDDRQRVEWFDPEIKALQARIDKALPATVNLPTDWSYDNNRVLVWSSSASDPGRYYLLDRKSRNMSPVVDPYPRIEASQLSEVRPIHYQSRDGLEIQAYLTLPRGRAAKGLPLILMPHGGPFSRDHWEYDATVQFLANRGYAVLQPQFRGSTGYGKVFVERGYGEWGRRMQDDLDDGVDWLAKAGQIDPKRVCIVGASYGGYAALWGAIRNPDRYRCAASLAGVSDLTAQLKYDRKAFSATRYYREWRTKVAGVGNVDLKEVSPLSHAARLTVPLLIAHGEKDDNVPPSQSRAMVNALVKANGPVTPIFYKDAGHGFSNATDLEDWFKRLEAFLAKHNPA